MKPPKLQDTPPKASATENQILKIREMRDLLEFELIQAAHVADAALKPTKRVPGFDREKYQPHELRKEIEPWLTALVQSEHLSLLLGAGLMNAVHHRVSG